MGEEATHTTMIMCGFERLWLTAAPYVEVKPYARLKAAPSRWWSTLVHFP
jgi:hypothetical protein